MRGRRRGPCPERRRAASAPEVPAVLRCQPRSPVEVNHRCDDVDRRVEGHRRRSVVVAVRVRSVASHSRGGFSGNRGYRRVQQYGLDEVSSQQHDTAPGGRSVTGFGGDSETRPAAPRTPRSGAERSPKCVGAKLLLRGARCATRRHSHALSCSYCCSAVQLLSQNRCPQGRQSVLCESDQRGVLP